MIQVEDITTESLEWMTAPDPVPALASWLDRAPDRIRVGFAMLDVRPPLDRCRAEIEMVASHRGAMERLIAEASWRGGIATGIDRSCGLLGSPPHSSVVSLVGVGRSNASAAYWRGEDLAFVWLESWLGIGATGTLQDMELDALPISVAHELGHAFRAALPGTASGERARLERVTSVWQAWEVRLAAGLDEAFFEEGLATNFSISAYPELALHRALFMPEEAVAWLDKHWRDLIVDRRRRWDLSRRPVELAWLADSLFLDRRRTAPWSIARPPSKWGYYVGLRLAQAATTGDWERDLTGAVPSLDLIC